MNKWEDVEYQDEFFYLTGSKFVQIRNIAHTLMGGQASSETQHQLAHELISIIGQAEIIGEIVTDQAEIEHIDRMRKLGQVLQARMRQNESSN